MRVMVKFIRDQKSYSNYTASHTTNHTAMTPPERIAVQQSYNLLTAISLGGVRPLANFLHTLSNRRLPLDTASFTGLKAQTWPCLWYGGRNMFMVWSRKYAMEAKICYRGGNSTVTEDVFRSSFSWLIRTGCWGKASCHQKLVPISMGGK